MKKDDPQHYSLRSRLLQPDSLAKHFHFPEANHGSLFPPES